MGFGTITIRRSVLLFLAMLVAQFLGMILIFAGKGAYYGAQGIPPVEVQALLEKDISAFAWGILAGGLLALVAVALFLESWRRAGALSDPQGLALRMPDDRRGYLIAIAGGLLLLVLVRGMFALWPPSEEALQGPLNEILKSRDQNWWFALIFMTILAPLYEEIVFRGALFSAFSSRWGQWPAAIVATLLFVGIHSGEKIHWLPGFAVVALLAVLTLLLRLRYRSLLSAILAHATYNLSLLLLM